MIHLSKRTFSKHLVAFGGAGFLGACGDSGAGGRPLWAADAQPPGYPTIVALEHMAATLRERTSGRLTMRLYTGGRLGPERDTIEMTMFGGLDFNRVSSAPLNPIAPATLVPALPFLFSSKDHMRRSVDGAPGREILQSLEAHGLKGLCFYDSGARSFYTTSRPIKTPDDLQGLKVRVQNSDLWVAMMNALGANATPMSFSEVFQALVQGVVDGAENNWPSYDTTRHFEAAPYYSTTEHVQAPEYLLMSLRRWQRLSAEDQQTVAEAAAASVPVMRGAWDRQVETSRQKVLEAGVILTQIDDKKPFQDLMQPVYERFVSPELLPLVEEIKSLDGASA